jgi:hypothetical protein
MESIVSQLPEGKQVFWNLKHSVFRFWHNAYHCFVSFWIKEAELQRKAEANRTGQRDRWSNRN